MCMMLYCYWPFDIDNFLLYADAGLLAIHHYSILSSNNSSFEYFALAFSILYGIGMFFVNHV